MRTAAIMLAGLAVVAAVAGCESPRHHRHHGQPHAVVPQKHHKHHKGAIPPPIVPKPVHRTAPRRGSVPQPIPPPIRY